MLPTLDLTLGGPAVGVSGFLLADGSGPPRQTTAASVQATTEALTIAFICADTDAWGTLKGRDAPVYKEECVEVFLAPGADDPRDYFEFELSPLGTFFEWNAKGATWKANVEKAKARWSAEIRLPWSSLGFPSPMRLPRTWRLNLYRIDRPRDGSTAEYSCWSPTLATPPNFHLPARFGTMRLG
jgi:hypothetical protein